MSLFEQMKLIRKNVEQINVLIPQDQRDKYHIIMGEQIIGTYTSLKDMNKAENEEFKYISCLKYIPSIDTTIITS